ncbi:hypothetical protein [Flavobacterium sp.]|uniref:hypothetical protein n=1 Tax=Flavobacterium sp. TaxID=239 RepID=UPI0025F7EE72|nr:hypothetical protein [Flavobacterium sp.]
MEILKKFMDGAKSLLADEKGAVSSKRFVGLLAAITLCVTMYHNSFSDISVAPADSLVNAVALLAFGALGLSSVDKFTGMKDQISNATKSTKKQEQEESYDYEG